MSTHGMNSKVIDKLDEKMTNVSSKTSSKFQKNILQQKNSLNTWNDIHNSLLSPQ